MVKSLYNLNTFHILNDDTVDMVIRLHIGSVLAVIIPHEKEHGDHSQYRGNQYSQTHAPVDCQHPDKNRNGEQEI